MVISLILLIGTLLASLVAFLYLKFVFLPKRRQEEYVRELTEKGIKVYCLPFQPFGFPHAEMLAKFGEEGDALKLHKNVLINYDVLIGNIFHKIQIVCVAKQSIRQLIIHENNFELRKLPLLTKSLEVVFGRGLLLTDGEQWKKRRMIMHQMFTFEFIKTLGPKFSSIFDKVQKKIKDSYQSKIRDGKMEIDLLEITSLYASSTVLEVFLGGQCLQIELQGQQLPKFIIHAVDQTNRYSELPQSLILGKYAMKLSLHPKTKKLNNSVNLYQKWGIDFVTKRIEEEKQKIYYNKQKKRPSNIIEAMVASENFNHLENPYKSAADIFEEFKTIFIGGSDSSAKYLQTMIYQLALSPEVERKVREEIDMHMKTQDYSYENLKKMKYIDAVQKEITRMYGPINFLVPREIIKDFSFFGVNLYRGDTMEYFADALHYSPKYFENPFQFKPERWLDEKSSELPLIGFNEGQRKCLSKSLALLTNKVGLIKFLKNYSKIEIPYDRIPLKIEVVVGPHNFNSILTFSNNQH